MKYRALKNFIFDSAYFDEGAVYEFDEVPAPIRDGYLEKMEESNHDIISPKDEPSEKITDEAVSDEADDVMQMPDLAPKKKRK